MKHQVNKLKLKKLGIDTQHEHVAFMHANCHVCISEGFEALTRISLSAGRRSIVANLNVIHSNLITEEEIALSESAIKTLHAVEGDMITVTHLSPIESLSHVRSKIYGNQLSAKEMKHIVNDVVKEHYSNVHLSAFITACAGNNLSIDEITFLTKAMIDTGKRIDWGKDMVIDKHSIGGLPGNRTTPIVVAILANLNLTMPKTSSRAITSPAGTADTMEIMTEVNLTLKQIKNVISKENACIAWGGLARLSPADDILIRIEKALDLDSEGQLIASVLSKKVAAGSTHVIIDMPVGETAKLRTIEAANKLKVNMEKVAHAIGLKIKVVLTDGTQPVGRGIGPALEAMDVLAVLRNERNAPEDLKERSLLLAGELIELAEKAEQGEGNILAAQILQSGLAYEKFKAICEAQGRFTEPRYAEFKFDVKAEKKGTVVNIDNRKLAKIAKLAGAPEDPDAGIYFSAPMGSTIHKGQTLFTVFAEAEGQLEYALKYLQSEHDSVITIQ